MLNDRGFPGLEGKKVNGPLKMITLPPHDPVACKQERSDIKTNDESTYTFAFHVVYMYV